MITTLKPLSGMFYAAPVAKRHSVPLGLAFPKILGFSSCEIAPGLEIRESTEADKQLLSELNKTWASMLQTMQVVPSPALSHVLCIDEKKYGAYVNENILNETGKKVDSEFSVFRVEDVHKMIIVAIHLFKLCPLYVTRYFVTNEYENNFEYLSILSPTTQVIWDSWQRYQVPISGYDLTADGIVMCNDIVRAVTILEKYYRHSHWAGNRIAVALHNFWNALFTRESTIAFISLVSIIETFTNLSKNEPATEQIYRNTPKLAPVDGHGKPVTRERLEEIYDARSLLAHGSYGKDGHGPLGWNMTHVDAKFSNVDVRLSTSAMSIAARLLHRVLFDSKIRSLIENARNSTQERRGLRGHLNAIAA